MEGFDRATRAGGGGWRIGFALPSRLSLSIRPCWKRSDLALFFRPTPATGAATFGSSGALALLHLVRTHAARLQNRCARMPPLPGPAPDSRRHSSARCHPKNPRLAQSALPRPTSGTPRRYRHDPARVGLKIACEPLQKPRSDSCAFKSSPRRHSAPCRSEFRDLPTIQVDIRPYCAIPGSSKPLKNHVRSWMSPLISLMHWEPPDFIQAYQ